MTAKGQGLAPSDQSEWLEADALGGFASGTTSGVATRRYHALLLVALQPPAARHVLVNDAAVWLETPQGRHRLSSHRAGPDVLVAGDVACSEFIAEPWPRFEYEVDGVRFSRELIVRHGLPLTLIRWRFERPLPGHRLLVRPLLSGRNFHALHSENPACRLQPLERDESLEPLERDQPGGLVRFQPYASLPAVISLANGRFEAAPEWYRRIDYPRERERGLEHLEDLASPGVLSFDLADPLADWVIAADGPEVRAFLGRRSARVIARDIEAREADRRAAFVAPLERAADAYLVRRGEGKTIIAGYPWFGDWGRDTFIALRGICLATGRYGEATAILLAWASSVSMGMLPNRFADDPNEPAEYNSVDAALWYVLAVGGLIERHAELAADARQRLVSAAEQVVLGHIRGTRHGIRVDADGLLAAGAPGLQLTWMDAKVGEHVITPRVGKPVEIQALWLNALAVVERLGRGQRELFERGRSSFAARFDGGARGLFDVVDVDHRPGLVDAAVRPNQVFAVGGLPLALLPAARCRQVLDVVEAQLWTPIGLRSLAPTEAGYASHYTGSMPERDAVYHQGTVWPWLLGPFVEAWVKARGSGTSARAEARQRFLAPWRQHLTLAGIGHVSEVADAEAPHEPSGCPFQAWSVSELIRVERDILTDERADSREARTI
jgi:predicted glycogen debranching enzyme